VSRKKYRFPALWLPALPLGTTLFSGADVTFDIIRRILTDYFGYDVRYVMNITDIDDKIILRARRNHLLAQHKQHLVERAAYDPPLEVLRSLAVQVGQAFELARERLKHHAADLEHQLSSSPRPAAARDEDLRERLATQAFQLRQLEHDRHVFVRLLASVSTVAVSALAAEASGGWPSAAAAAGTSSDRDCHGGLGISSDDRVDKTCPGGDDSEAPSGDTKSNDRAGRPDPIETAVQDLSLEQQVQRLIAAASNVLGDLLDADHGAQVTDEFIFAAHARRYEREFHEDMAALGVRPPDALTRVTEYVDKIVAYAQQIVANGFAYPSKDPADDTAGCSVYFDVAAFSRTHAYGKLAPWSVGNLSALAEGEGSSSSSSPASMAKTEKRSPHDFVLWKKSKPGEPAWPSPWGPGRPGWHIECSAMARSAGRVSFCQWCTARSGVTAQRGRSRSLGNCATNISFCSLWPIDGGLIRCGCC